MKRDECPLPIGMHTETGSSLFILTLLKVYRNTIHPDKVCEGPLPIALFTTMV